MELTLLNHQPEFPEQDLTQTNAAFFEFFLQNGTLLEASHSGAEQSNLLFNLAHLAATHSKDTFIDDSHHAGFTHGFTLYEIMSSLIAPRTDYFTDVTAMAATRSLNIALRTKKQDELLNDARDEFRSVQPNCSRSHWTGGRTVLSRHSALRSHGCCYRASVRA
ncbi:hypothetical protein D3C72_1201090 [compost metagenome]